MRLARVAAVAMCCTSCQSFELNLVFEIPAKYRSFVSQLQVQLVTPPATDDGGLQFDCDSIAYGDLGPMDLAARQEAAWSFAPDASVALGAISRTGNKLFTVNGVDSSGKRIVAGCGQVGTLTQATELDITTYPLVHVTTSTATIELDAGSPPLPLTVSATDVFGRPRGPVPFRYGVSTVDAPTQGGFSVDGGLEVARPSRRGPFTVTIAAAWSAEAPLQVPGMLDPDAVELRLPTLLQSMRAGRFLADGGTAAAVLTDNGTLLFATGGALQPHPVANIDAGQPLQLLSVREPGGREPLFAVGDAVYAIVENAPPTQVAPLPAQLFSSIFPLDAACDGSQIRFAFNLTNPNLQGVPLLLLPGEDGGQVAPGRVLAAGCIDLEADGGTALALVLDSPSGRGLSAVDRSAPWWGVGDGVGFTASPLHPRELVGVEAFGQVFDLFLARPALVGNTLTVVPSASLAPVPQVPASIITGDFDGNTQLDVAALMGIPSESGPPGYAVLLVLQGNPTPQGLPAPVVGGIGLGQFRCPPQIDAANLFGGPGDELIIGFRCDPAAPLLRVYSFE